MDLRGELLAGALKGLTDAERGMQKVQERLSTRLTKLEICKGQEKGGSGNSQCSEALGKLR